MYLQYLYLSKVIPHSRLIVYKKTDEWQRMTTSGTTSDNEWQRMTTSGTTSDNEWYKEWQRMTTSDNEWYNKWQRVTTSGTTSDNEWKPVASNDEKWQRVAILPKLLFSNNMVLVWAVLPFITPEVTADSSNRRIQNLCKFIKEGYCDIS